MVSIVIVSHSAKLAEGAQELAHQMVQGEVALAAAGGIDDPENPIGTDAMKVHEAINAVYSEDGVVVLMDLGSALLSAEMALEFLSPEQQANVYLCEAPLVEGLMAAAVQASVGGNVQQVMAEARGALAVKENQLQPAATTEVAEPVAEQTEPAGPVEELSLVIRNRLGLHARPAALFVSTANRFEADILVKKGDKSATAKSINQVATLGVRQGDEILVTATGADATLALAAIKSLADDNFGESEEDIVETEPLPATIRPADEGELAGIAASPGIAIGPVVQYRPRLPEVPLLQVNDPAGEWARLQEAIDQAKGEIQAIHEQAVRQAGATEAAIFEAHLLFLQDPALVEVARSRLFDESINAEAAWYDVVEETAGSYKALDDPYMQARAADVLDVGQRVLQHLMAFEPPTLDFEEPAILLAADLKPSDTARLDPAKVLGICTELGGATSHSAILARALGIPAIVGLGAALEAIPDGQTIAIDGRQGRLWLQPDNEQLAKLQASRAEWLADQQRAKEASAGTAVTQDGHRIEVAANIGGPHDAPIALEFGAEGVGLFRTEFLFLDRETAPTEEEQLAAYRQVAETMAGKPLIIRTLDVGGDKPLPYIDLGEEDNPFLGWRGIRFCLDQPGIFKPQLRAILRASSGHNIKLMFPMIGALDEVVTAKKLLDVVREELMAEGLPFDEDMEVGIMIEVPSAVAIADQLAAEVDFFSIGTNDLTQYVMAADRGNAKVSGLANALQPAVLRMVQMTVQAAHAVGIWVGMCGELAGNPLATPVLVGLGLDELSMNAPAIPNVKEAIRGLTLDKAREIATNVLQCNSAELVANYLSSG
ncbi:MAG: phosphoenolpyruvate--protein phosphotransferase [Chloroflexota bacterium]|jgi:phosphocarrier protein FPr